MPKSTYKQKKDLKRAALAAAGLVSQHFSGVSSIEFRMTYYRSGLNQVLMKRILSFTPADYAGFHLECMADGCTNGGYDLSSVVKAMVEARTKSARGKIFCQGVSNTAGHASLAYEVCIEYNGQDK